jgi:hypothetical protein
MDDLARLVAINELQNFQARYLHYLDSKKWDLYGQMFTEDAEIAAPGTTTLVGREQIVAAISAVLANATTVHLIHQSEVVVESEHRAHGTWAMTDYQVYHEGTSMPPFTVPTPAVRGYGHYVEDFVKVGSNWQCARMSLYRRRLETVTVGNTDYPDPLFSSP